MPDIALLHGRMMVMAWDAELDGGGLKPLKLRHLTKHLNYDNLKELTMNL
jgi:hypothetical protein